MTEQPPPITMRVLDGEPTPPPRPRPRPGSRAAAATLAAAGILAIIGSLTPLSHLAISDQSGLVFVPANAYNSMASFFGSPATSERYPLIGLGIVALVVAAVLGGRALPMRWARPIATLAGGLLVGGLVMVALSLPRTVVLGLDNLELHTVLDTGAWLCLASLIAAIATITLALRLPDDPPAPDPEPATPPLGIPVIDPGQDGEHGTIS